MEGTDKRHPIQVVSRRTGMTADRLRAWEKRYGVVEPARSDGGRRLYSDEDIDLLRLLHRAILGGRRISWVAGLDVRQLSDLVREDEEAEAERPHERLAEDAGTSPELYLAACLSAVDGLNARGLESVLKRAALNLSACTLIERVVAPLMNQIGDRWHAGELSPAHEHLASQVARRVLDDVLEATDPAAEARNLVVATPAGQLHELGALFVAATAAAQGWRVTYLGPDLPAGDIARVVCETGATAVALSLLYPVADSSTEVELRELSWGLPSGTTLLVGGAACPSYRSVLREIEAIDSNDMIDLLRTLSQLA